MTVVLGAEFATEPFGQPAGIWQPDPAPSTSPEDVAEQLQDELELQSQRDLIEAVNRLAYLMAEQPEPSVASPVVIPQFPVEVLQGLRALLERPTFDPTILAHLQALTDAVSKQSKKITAGALQGVGGGSSSLQVNGHSVDASNPVPVSGSLSVDTSLLAKGLTQTDGTQKTQITNFPAVQVVQDISVDLRYSGGKTPYSAVVSASGDTVIHTPATGKAITLYWVGVIPNSDNGSANLTTIQFGATGGSPTTLYSGYALAHWEPFTGAVNQPLVVNLASAQAVSVNAHFSEA